MPGRAKMTLLVCVCTGAIAGCGGSDENTEIPSDPADRLLTRLAELEEQVQDGECDDPLDGAVAQAEEIARIIDEDLPDDYDPETREGLAAAADNLVELTVAECVEGEGSEPPDRDRTTTTESTTEPTTTETTTTETTTTSSTTTTSTDEEEPPDPGDTGGGPTGGDNPGGGSTGGGGDPPDIDIGEPVPPSGGVGGERRAP